MIQYALCNILLNKKKKNPTKVQNHRPLFAVGKDQEQKGKACYCRNAAVICGHKSSKTTGPVGNKKK